MAQDNPTSLWRREAPVKLPGQTPGTTRRAVFLWMLALLAVMGSLVSVFAWIRAEPKPLFAPVWLGPHVAAPLHAPPFAGQDAKAIRDGGYFGRPVALTALADASSSDTIVVYLSGQAIC